MLAKLHRSHRRHGMKVIGCRHNDRIYVLLLLQHDPEIAVGLCFRILLVCFRRLDIVDIAEGDYVLAFAGIDLFPRKVVDVGIAHTAGADCRHIEPVAR